MADADDDDGAALADDEPDEDDEPDADDDDDADDEDDADEDDGELSPEEAAELRAELKRANRDASRARRALKANKRPKPKPSDPDAAIQAREARVAVKELLADNGLPTSAAKLVDLAQLDLADGELSDPDDVLDMVRAELEDLGLKLTDDDEPEPTKKAARKKARPAARRAPRDRAGRKADSSKSVSEQLVEQAGLA
jgi:hypothetical protein